MKVVPTRTTESSPHRAAWIVGILTVVTAGSLAAQTPADATIVEASSATIPSIAGNATIVDWEGEVLRQGSNGWTCMPTPPGMAGESPMCLDGPLLQWARAWQGRTEPALDGAGVAYMLRGDGGVSNSDPFASDPSAVDDWVQAGPHLMLVAPDPSIFDGISTDPGNGGPWVMWKGTPYAHVMIPVPGS